jgi:hypothetical protein
MIFGYFTLVVALIISAIAEYYSIVGLTSIFSAAVIPVVIMGAALGVGKVTAAIWLKLNWARSSLAYKLYLVPAVAFLMVLTSMGIFGFLSKAHSDQSLVGGDVAAQIAIYDEKIKTSKDNIDTNRKALKQMDEAVDQVMGRSSDEKGADKAVQIRRSQAKERTRLQNEITAEQKTIISLNEQRAPIAAEVRKVEAEVGPIKYIAAMVYGDNPDSSILEKSVRWVIILIVIVFDPLALMLILAGQQSLRWAREEKAEAEATTESVEEFFRRGKEVARELDKEAHERIQQELAETMQDLGIVIKPEAAPKNKDEPPVDFDKHPYLLKPFAHFKDTKPMVAKPLVAPLTIQRVIVVQPDYDWADEPKYEHDGGPLTKEQIERIEATVAPELLDAEKTTVSTLFPEVEAVNIVKKATVPTAETMDVVKPTAVPVREAAEPPKKTIINVAEAFDTTTKTTDSALTADNDTDGAREIKAQFGIEFPSNPERGELYLRVDYLPSRLFKYNSTKWIEVDKTMTDSYVYNEEYIKYLIDEIAAGLIDIDEVSPSERDQITEFLKNNEQSRNPT